MYILSVSQKIAYVNTQQKILSELFCSGRKEIEWII